MFTQGLQLGYHNVINITVQKKEQCLGWSACKHEITTTTYTSARFSGAVRRLEQYIFVLGVPPLFAAIILPKLIVFKLPLYISSYCGSGQLANDNFPFYTISFLEEHIHSHILG